MKVLPFIEDMATAYKAKGCSRVRAGALTISELALVGNPSLLVPSQTFAEDHQTHNAMSLVKHGAALMVKDVEAATAHTPQLAALIRTKRKTKNTDKPSKRHG